MDGIRWVRLLELPYGFLIAAVAMIVLYVVFRNKSALSKHAFQNAWASMAVASANIIALFLFVDDLNEFAQATYNVLGVPKLNPDFWEGFPLWFVCLIGIATKDFVDYWNHRLMHTRWGWPTHAAHHSDTHVNAFTTWRIHILEFILMTFSYILLLTWLQMPEAIPVVAAFYWIHNIYVHMELDYGHGPLKLLIASPPFHRWHHADVKEAHGKNLANIIPIYDLIFGTYYNPGLCREKMGALSSGIEDKNPILIYIYPIQEWSRLIKKFVAGLKAGFHRRAEAGGDVIDDIEAQSVAIGGRSRHGD